MTTHDGHLKYQRNLTYSWGFWCECTCGDKSTDDNPLLGTKKAAYRWFANHKQKGVL